jgi:hypothetical protein
LRVNIMKLVRSCDGGQSASASTSGCPGSGISGLIPVNN